MRHENKTTLVYIAINGDYLGDFLKRMIGIRLVVVRILYFVLVCVVSRAVWPHFERWVRDSPTVEGVIRHRIQWTCGFFLNKK